MNISPLIHLFRSHCPLTHAPYWFLSHSFLSSFKFYLCALRCAPYVAKADRFLAWFVSVCVCCVVFLTLIILKHCGIDCKHEFIKLMLKTLETVGGVSKKVFKLFLTVIFLPLKCMQVHAHTHTRAYMEETRFHQIWVSPTGSKAQGRFLIYFLNHFSVIFRSMLRYMYSKKRKNKETHNEHWKMNKYYILCNIIFVL